MRTIVRNLLLALDYRNRPAKGRSNLVCSSFVSRLKGPLSFWAQRSTMIANFIPCSTRAFSDDLERVAMKYFFGGKPPDPHPLPHMVLFCVIQLWASVVKHVRLVIVGEDDVVSYVYYGCNGILLNLSSQHGCNS